MTQVQNQEQRQPQNQGQELCTWCATNAGRTQANRPCCKLRRLALAPSAAQAEFAKHLTVDERSELRPRLKAEIKRLKELT